GVDLLDAQMRLRVPRRAVVAGHLLPLDDARGVSAGAHGTRATMLGVAVRVRTTADAVALHDTLEAATLGGAGDLDGLTGLEDADRDQITDVVRRDLDRG